MVMYIGTIPRNQGTKMLLAALGAIGHFSILTNLIPLELVSPSSIKF